ncbi:hypothetical protein D3C86_1984110 [compost metagenome]
MDSFEGNSPSIFISVPEVETDVEATFSVSAFLHPKFKIRNENAIIIRYLFFIMLYT